MDILSREFDVLARKEAALTAIIAWLKGKGLWEECNRDLRIVASKPVDPDQIELE